MVTTLCAGVTQANEKFVGAQNENTKN
jgi:hypothetical protein